MEIDIHMYIGILILMHYIAIQTTTRSSENAKFIDSFFTSMTSNTNEFT